jgi:hypothetical protein
MIASLASDGGLFMTNIETHILNLQAKSTSIEPEAGLELSKAIRQLQRHMPDRLFLLREAQYCRRLAVDAIDPELVANLQRLAAELEREALRPL